MKVVETDEKGVTILEGSMVVDGTTLNVTGKQYVNSDGEKIKLHIPTDDFYAVMKANGVERKTIDAIDGIKERLTEAAFELMTKDVEERPSFTKRELTFGNTGLGASLKPWTQVPDGNFTEGQPKTKRDVWGQYTVSQDMAMPTAYRKKSEGLAELQARVEKAMSSLTKPEKKAA